MLNNSAILKAIAGVSTIGTTGTVGYIYRKEIENLFSTSNIQTFLVTKTDDTSAQPTNEPYINNEKNVETKNFVCKFGDTEKDEGCELFELDVDSTKKFLDLKAIKEKNVLIKKKDKLTKDSFYKLTIDVKKFSSEIKIDLSTIDMVALTAGNNNHIFAKLKVIAKIEDKTVSASNTNILVKAKAAGESASSTDFNCQLNDTTELKCKVFKFNGNNLANLKDISFATTTSFSDLNEAKAANYYVIDFSSETDVNKKQKLTNENISKTIVFVGTDKAKKVEFNFDAKIVGKFDATSGNSHNVLLLKDVPEFKQTQATT